MAEMTKEEQIAFHRGALQTLMGEQNELMTMINKVQQFSQAHVAGLKELGIDYVAEMKAAQEAAQKAQPASGEGDLAGRLG